MKISIQLCLAIIILLIFKTVSIVDIKGYPSVMQTMSDFYSSYLLNTSLVANDGQLIYIGSGNFVDIWSINLTIETASYVSSYFDNNGQINFDRLFIFNTYMICYSTENLFIDVYGLADFSFYQNFTINQYVDQFYHASSKAIVLYRTVNGKIGFIPDISFISSSQTHLIDQNFLTASYVTFQVSNDQNYIAIAGDINSTLSSVYIYSLPGSVLTCQYNLPISGIGDIDWMTNNQILLIATSISGNMIKLNITTCSQIIQSVTSASIYEIAKLTYYSLTNQAIFIGLSISTPYNYAIYSFSLDTNSITFLKEYVSNYTLLSYNYENDNRNYFTLSLINTVQLFTIVPVCTNNTIYDVSIYSCVQQNISISANITNLTTNITSNATSNINITVPLNNTLVNVNTTGSINSTNSTILPASNSSINSTDFFQQMTEFEEDFQRFIKMTLGNKIILTGNLVPGSRRVLQPFFTFFINIDDLWLYNYHEREYDTAITTVFNSVQQLQNQKWTLLQFQKIWTYIQLDSNSTIQQFSCKYNYSSWKFIQVEQNSNGFILNTLNFFCSNFFLMLIIFVVLRVLFFLLFNYRISIIFRQYSFWLYFMMMVLQGNVQYLTYLFSFQMKNFFSANFLNKIGLGVSVVLYFIIFIFAGAAFSIIKHQYGRFIFYFIQNLKICIVSFAYLTFQTGFRNILLGFLHIMFDSYYKLKIGSLIFTEIVFLLLTIILLIRENIFINHLKVWLNIIAVVLRILFVFTLFLFDNHIQKVVQHVHITIFYIYFSQLFVFLGIQLIKAIIYSLNFIKNEKKIEQKEEIIIKNKKYQQKTSKVSKKCKIQQIKQEIFQLQLKLQQNQSIQKQKQLNLQKKDCNLILIKRRQNKIKPIHFKILNKPSLFYIQANHDFFDQELN